MRKHACNNFREETFSSIKTKIRYVPTEKLKIIKVKKMRIDFQKNFNLF